jgi:Plasmid pRiA4b ORF-3-like protein
MTSTIHQFKITLCHVDPPVWRRIQVQSSYSFWDLHVAIQDAMGWLDYHLHSFSLGDSKSTPVGIPDDDFGQKVLAGWKVPIAKHFKVPGNVAQYRYDFGDGWQHDVLLEGILLIDPDTSYPRCMAGGRACPPEDCGGTPGYARLLQILQAPGTVEYDEKISWLRGHAQNYLPFRSEHFNATETKFSDPVARWKSAFAQ